MRILIAYDGSGNSRYSLDELTMSGLPSLAEIFIIGVAEVWLSPQSQQIKGLGDSDQNIADYFQKHSEQIGRNLAETEVLLTEAEEKLHKNFPVWKIKTEAVSGSAAGQILSKAKQLRSELIIIGAQGLSWDNTDRLGGISNKILVEAICPVRISKTKNELGTNSLKIAICFDGSPGSVKAVKAVVSRNWRQKIQIRLLTVTDFFNPLITGRVFRVIPGLPEGQMIGEKKWINLLANEAMQILNEAGYSSELHIYSGNPRIVLVNEITSWGADLVFIGGVSGDLQNRPLGSVAWAVAARSLCTVEIIR